MDQNSKTMEKKKSSKWISYNIKILTNIPENRRLSDYVKEKITN